MAPAFIVDAFRDAQDGERASGRGRPAWVRGCPPFLWTERPTLWAAVTADLLSGWSLPYDSWAILSNFIGWLDESTIKSINN